MKKLYRLLLLAVMFIGVGFSAQATRFIDITSNDWEHIVLQNNMNGSITNWSAPTDGNTYHYQTALAVSMGKVRGPQIQVMEGYKAEITYTIDGKEPAVATPNETPDAGYAATYFFPFATYAPENSVTNYINVTITPEGGDEPGEEPVAEAAPYYLIRMQSNNWQAFDITQNTGTANLIDDWMEDGDPDDYYVYNSGRNWSVTGGLTFDIHTGYKAILKFTPTGGEQSIIEPQEVTTEGFTQTYFLEFGKYFNGNGNTNIVGPDRNQLYIEIVEDSGEEPEEPEEPVVDKGWPAAGYGFDIEWNIAGALKFTQGSTAVSVADDATTYRHWDSASDNPYTAKSIKVEAKEGYKINRVYYIDKETEEETKVVSWGTAYTLSCSRFDRNTVYIEVEKEGLDSKFTLSFVNTPEAFDFIELPGSGKTLKATFENKDEAKEFEFAAADDNKANIWFNSQTWEDYIEQDAVYNELGEFVYDEDGNQIFNEVARKRVRKVYKLIKNGEDITEKALRSSTGSYFYQVDIADGDEFIAQPFEVTSDKAKYTLTVDAGAGVIKSIFNKTMMKNVALDANKQITVLDGTELVFHFNDDLTLESATYAGTNLADWTNEGGSVIVNANGTLEIKAKATEYGEVTYTAYISAADGVTVYAGNANGPVVDLGEGEAIDSDINLPAISSASSPAWTMTTADTRKYTFKISSKYERVLVMTKPGYWFRTIRGASVSKEETCDLKSITDKTFYVAAEKIENDSKATIYFAGDPTKVAIRASRLHDAEITHAITNAGYSEFEFDSDYESPFDLTGLMVMDGAATVAGEPVASISVMVDGVVQGPDDNGVFTALPIKNNSLLKIFCDGKTYKQQNIQFNAEAGATAEVTYDRVLTHNIADVLKAYEGMEVAIKPGEKTKVTFNRYNEDDELISSQEIAADENGVCTLTVPAYKSDVYRSEIALSYTGAPIADYVLTPADGSTVTEDFKTFTIGFPNATTATRNEEKANDEILLKRGHAFGANPSEIKAVEGAEYPTFDIIFNTTQIMANGTYTLIIPQDMFIINGTAGNADIDAQFTLEKAASDLTSHAEPFTGKQLLTPWGINVAVVYTDESLSIRVADNSKISVKLNDKELSYADGEYSIHIEANMFMIDVASSVAEAGKLELTAEEGALSLSGTPSPAIAESWEIVAPVECTYNITPADGAKVGDLTKVTIAIEGATEATVFNETGISLFTNNYKYYESGVITPVEGAAVPTFTVEFPAQTILGAYTLRVSYGTFSINGVQDSDPFSASYTLIDPLKNYTLSPAEGEEVETLEAITIAFPEATSVEIDEEQVEAVMMRNSMWSYFGYAEAIEAVEGAEVPTFEIKFESLPTAGGEYSIIIPEGLFKSGNNASEEIYSSFTILGNGEEIDYSWYAAPDEVIDLDASWNSETVTVGFMFADESIMVELADPMVSIMMNDTELIAGEDFTCEANYNFIMFEINANVLKAGSLEIYLGMGSIAINGEMFYENMSHTWTTTKTETGINDITVDGAAQDIYNLQGIKLDTDYSKLPTGVYVIGGRKVLKK